jgi:predicted HTH transcriptional regulator
LEVQYKAQNKAQNKAQSKLSDNCALIAAALMDFLSDHPRATQIDLAEAIGASRRTIQNTMAELKTLGLIEREGARKNGRWLVKQQSE